MKCALIPALLFLFPLGFHASRGERLRGLFQDTRPTYRAVPLETIYGAEAGQRVDVPEVMVNRTYTVKTGDTWWTIAKDHNVADPNALSAHNHHVQLFPGMIIEIPADMMEHP